GRAHGDDELVSLPVIVSVVGVLARLRSAARTLGIALAVRLLVAHRRTGRAQLQRLRLVVPRPAAVRGERRDDRLVDVLRTPVEFPLRFVARTGGEGEIVGLLALGAGVADLLARRVAVAGRLEAVGRAGLLQRPWTADDRRRARRRQGHPRDGVGR